jgi:hypothetical protein
MELDELFAEKSNRDARYKELQQNSNYAGKLKRYTVRGQQIHPMYVEDRKNTPDGRDRGFGNIVYKTYFSVLYGVRELRA